MRDIRADLQERAKLLEGQIDATQAQFNAFLEQLRREHQSKLDDLKAYLSTLHAVMKVEGRRLGFQTVPFPSQQAQQQQKPEINRQDGACSAA